MRVYIVSMYNIDAANFDGADAETVAVCASPELAYKVAERMRSLFSNYLFNIEGFELQEEV